MNKLLDKLFRRYNNELLAFATNQSNINIAEDIVQESFLRLLQRSDFATLENPRAYLFKIASNLSKNAYDYDQVRRRYQPDKTIEIDEIAADIPTIESTIAAQQKIEHFLFVVNQIPETVQHAFILSKLEGLSYLDVAATLDISEKSAQRYVLKAWQHLIKHLGNDFFE